MHRRCVNHWRAATKSFCENTSMQGFSEVYQSNSLFWRLFWVFIVSAAIGVTTYQVYQTTVQYINQPATTVIGPIDDEKIYFPPLRLCYWQWYFWVDWNKATSLNYTKDFLLYTFRFFNSIYTTYPFDFEVARMKFNNVMIKNKFSGFFDLFNSMARKVPIISEDKVEDYFDKTEILYRDPYLLFCYVISEENMKKYFASRQSRKIMTFYTLDETFSKVNGFLNTIEYNNYILRWADKSSMYKIKNDSSVDLTAFAPPISLFVFNNVPKGLEMVAQNDAYLVSVRASVFTWQNKLDKICAENKLDIASVNTTCQNLCEATFRRMTCNCQRLDQAILLKDESNDKICHKDTIFLNLNKDIVLSNVTVNELVRSPYNCPANTEQLQYWRTCMKNCLPGCQMWKFEKTITIQSTSPILQKHGKKNMTQVGIEYPNGNDIIVMTEIDAKTWENFVGNVGGLLGIWTGASVISLVQIIYLCCCAHY